MRKRCIFDVISSLKSNFFQIWSSAGEIFWMNNNNNNNSLLTLLAVKNWMNSAIYNWILIIKSIYNNKYYNNNWNHENLKVKRSFALFDFFIVEVVLVFPDLNWYRIDLVITCRAKKDMGWLSFLISAFNFLHMNILRSANDVKFAWSRACW